MGEEEKDEEKDEEKEEEIKDTVPDSFINDIYTSEGRQASHTEGEKSDEKHDVEEEVAEDKMDDSTKEDPQNEIKTQRDELLLDKKSSMKSEPESKPSQSVEDNIEETKKKKENEEGDIKELNGETSIEAQLDTNEMKEMAESNNKDKPAKEFIASDNELIPDTAPDSFINEIYTSEGRQSLSEKDITNNEKETKCEDTAPDAFINEIYSTEGRQALPENESDLSLPEESRSETDDIKDENSEDKVSIASNDLIIVHEKETTIQKDVVDQENSSYDKPKESDIEEKAKELKVLDILSMPKRKTNL